MFKKVFVVIMMFFVLSMVSACNEEEPLTEVITTSGLDEVHIFIGESYDFMDGVIFTSNTRGDITESVTILDTVDTNSIGVVIIRYQTHYENDDEFLSERRVVVLYPEDEDNMIINGDFSNSIDHWGFHRHNDYPDEIGFIVDPDLIRLQVLVDSTSNEICWPFMESSPLNLSSTETYTFSILVSGTVSTFFTVDIVEMDQFNIVTTELINDQTITVGLVSAGMQVVTFDFTPLQDSQDAYLRLMFGGNGTSSPQGHIFIDNVHLEVAVG